MAKKQVSLFSFLKPSSVSTKKDNENKIKLVVNSVVNN